MTVLDWKGQPVEVKPIGAETDWDAYEARLASFPQLVCEPPRSNAAIHILPPLPRWTRFRIWLARALVRLLRVDPEEL